MSDNLFLRATRAKLRFQSPAGLLTTEDLFDLPIKTTDSRKASLEVVGNILLQQQRDVPATSILSTEATNPAYARLELQIEVVKFVIATKQAEADAAAKALAIKQEKDRLRELIATRKAAETPVADLEAQLAALGG